MNLQTLLLLPGSHLPLSTGAAKALFQFISCNNLAEAEGRQGWEAELHTSPELASSHNQQLSWTLSFLPVHLGKHFFQLTFSLIQTVFAVKLWNSVGDSSHPKPLPLQLA